MQTPQYEIAGGRISQRFPLPPECPSDAPTVEITRWRAAYPVLDTWLASGVPLAGALRRLGLTLWTAGRLQAAAESLAASVSADGEDGAAWLDLGLCLRAIGEAGRARGAFERATEKAPGHARAWLALGLAAKENGELRRAEETLERAVALDADLDDAAYSLGLIYFESRRYPEAAACWRAPAARGYKTGAIRVGLGQCFFFLGDFAAAGDLLAAHLADFPGDEAIARRYALVRLLDGAVRGGPEAARAAYSAAAGAGAEPIETIARSGFLLLAGYGHAAAALAVARAFLDETGFDPILQHHMAALSGEARARAPREFVAAYFDRFASTFDEQMATLGYRGPEMLAALVEAAGSNTRRVLDLGCGSGAAATLLRPRCAFLAGVDLSAKMVEKAGERGLYDELAVADMVEYLAGQSEAFDLVFAADSLIYLGDLEPLLRAASAALSAGGLLAVTLETATDTSYLLQASGRFAHSPRALIESAARWFDLRATQRAFLRLEANQKIHGELIVLERRG